MFDIEAAVAIWRRSLEYNAAFSADDIDELEQHLREQVDGLVALGHPAETAFALAMREMGDHGTAESEYRKVYWGKRRRRGELRSELIARSSMLGNYLKVAIRSMLRRKGFTLINVCGLALGVACCLMIGLYVAHEVSFDRQFENADRLYRVVGDYRAGGQSGRGAIVATPVAAALQSDYPEVEAATRLAPDLAQAGTNLVRTADTDQNRFEPGFVVVDPSFLDLFSFPMVAGGGPAALAEPNSVILTERKARLFFPDGDPIGQTLILNDNVDAPFVITGVMEDLPSNTHFEFDYLVSMEGVPESKIENWGFNNFVAYLRLAPDADPQALEAKLPDFLMRHNGDRIRQLIDTGGSVRYTLQPLVDIHLQSADIRGYGRIGNIQYVWLFGAVAVFVLLLAAINFTNLATARSMERSREIGLRKVLGSHRGQLVAQFLSESMVVSALAVLCGVLLVVVLLPVFNATTGQALSLPWTSPGFVPLLLGFAVVLGLLAGAYPAGVLSAFRPIRVLKGQQVVGGRGTLRAALVVFQFATSIVLISSSLIVWSQMEYIQTMNLGFDKDQVLVVEDSYMLGDQIGSFKEAIEGLPTVQRATVTSFVPVDGYRQNYSGAWPATEEPEQSRVGLAKWFVDTDYISTMGMRIVAGRDFSEALASDSSAMILNETAVAELGFEDPIGKTVSSYTALDPVTGQLTVGTYTVIGVVEDFNFLSVKNDVEGLSLVRGGFGTSTAVKFRADNVAQTLAGVQATWARFAPNQPLRFTFLDERFDQMYLAEQRAGDLFSIFTVFAILIACLGLFGLASFTAASRTKEIGVRKVLGASATSIVALLAREFVVLVAAAFVVAVPIAYLFMDGWLEAFAYRVDIGAGVFAAAGVLALAIALLTISYKAIRAALVNPVDSLRYE